MKLVRPWIALVLSGIFLLSGSLFYAHSRWLPHSSALPVKMVAHAWWWEFDYPTLGIKTSDELHLPSNRWIRLDLQSADVVHSFWIDGMSKAIDLLPGKIERLDLRVKSPGKLYGNCDAGCGCGTVCMRFRVLASTPSDFNRWAAGQKNAPQQLTLAGSTVAPACAVDKSIDHQGVAQASRPIDPSIKKTASSHRR